MKPSRLSQAGTTALAGALLLAPVHQLLAADARPLGVQILSWRQIGSLFEIILLNPASQTRQGSVVVELLLNGRTSTMVVPFSVHEGQKTFVQPVTPSAQIVRVGVIVDDGIPF